MAKSPSERHFYFHMHNTSLRGAANSSSRWNHIHTLNHAQTIYIAYTLACLLLHTEPKNLGQFDWRKQVKSDTNVTTRYQPISGCSFSDLTLTCVSLTPTTHWLSAGRWVDESKDQGHTTFTKLSLWKWNANQPHFLSALYHSNKQAELIDVLPVSKRFWEQSKLD